MSRKYTAADFVNARFAEHPETGQIAARLNVNPEFPWTFNRGYRTDGYKDAGMAFAGWVPVPTKPTIEFTESQVGAIGRDAINYFKPGGTWADWARAVFMSADFEIIPDPEPTNTDRLEQLIRESGYEVFTLGHHADARELAEWLNNDGVKAPDA